MTPSGPRKPRHQARKGMGAWNGGLLFFLLVSAGSGLNSSQATEPNMKDITASSAFLNGEEHIAKDNRVTSNKNATKLDHEKVSSKEKNANNRTESIEDHQLFSISDSLPKKNVPMATFLPFSTSRMFIRTLSPVTEAPQHPFFPPDPMHTIPTMTKVPQPHIPPYDFSMFPPVTDLPQPAFSSDLTANSMMPPMLVVHQPAISLKLISNDLVAQIANIPQPTFFADPTPSRITIPTEKIIQKDHFPNLTPTTIVKPMNEVLKSMISSDTSPTINAPLAVKVQHPVISSEDTPSRMMPQLAGITQTVFYVTPSPISERGTQIEKMIDHPWVLMESPLKESVNTPIENQAIITSGEKSRKESIKKDRKEAIPIAPYVEINPWIWEKKHLLETPLSPPTSSLPLDENPELSQLDSGKSGHPHTNLPTKIYTPLVESEGILSTALLEGGVTDYVDIPGRGTISGKVAYFTTFTTWRPSVSTIGPLEKDFISEELELPYIPPATASAAVERSGLLDHMTPPQITRLHQSIRKSTELITTSQPFTFHSSTKETSTSDYLPTFRMPRSRSTMEVKPLPKEIAMSVIPTSKWNKIHLAATITTKVETFSPPPHLTHSLLFTHDRQEPVFTELQNGKGTSNPGTSLAKDKASTSVTETPSFENMHVSEPTMTLQVTSQEREIDWAVLSKGDDYPTEGSLAWNPDLMDHNEILRPLVVSTLKTAPAALNEQQHPQHTEMLAIAPDEAPGHEPLNILHVNMVSASGMTQLLPSPWTDSIAAEQKIDLTINTTSYVPSVFKEAIQLNPLSAKPQEKNIFQPDDFKLYPLPSRGPIATKLLLHEPPQFQMDPGIPSPSGPQRPLEEMRISGAIGDHITPMIIVLFDSEDELKNFTIITHVAWPWENLCAPYWGHSSLPAAAVIATKHLSPSPSKSLSSILAITAELSPGELSSDCDNDWCTDSPAKKAPTKKCPLETVSLGPQDLIPDLAILWEQTLLVLGLIDALTDK
ncbi:hypothetical protein NDU88_003852 [Pleurodeles waltl]|uniref:Uncharacterized protein n=1 Tax=Pleurodeles waltl TaxID=8319 RepID=A0AAV7T6H7_PLEWA|nr:hypothetical protein NDU88_003852 [Pleurodeles waltl]